MLRQPSLSSGQRRGPLRSRAFGLLPSAQRSLRIRTHEPASASTGQAGVRHVPRRSGLRDTQRTAGTQATRSTEAEQSGTRRKHVECEEPHDESDRSEGGSSKGSAERPDRRSSHRGAGRSSERPNQRVRRSVERHSRHYRQNQQEGARTTAVLSNGEEVSGRDDVVPGRHVRLWRDREHVGAERGFRS